MPERVYAISLSFAALSFCLFLGINSPAQPKTISVQIPLSNENFSLSGSSCYASTGEDAKDVTKILSGAFYPLKEKGKVPPVSLLHAEKYTWIWFSISNQLMADTSVILKIEPSIERMILYEQVNGNFAERGRSGKTMPVTRLSIWEDDKRIRVLLQAGQTQFFLLQQQGSKGTGFSVPVLQSEGQAALEQGLYARTVTMPRRYLFILLAGFHLSIFFFTLIKYYSQKGDRAYLLYSLFNGGTCILYLTDINVLIIESSLWSNLKNNVEGSFVFNVANSLLYVAFEIELLQLQKSRPRIVRWVKVYAGVIVVGMVLTLIANQLAIFPFIWEWTLLLFQAGYILGSGVLIYLTRKLQGFYRYVYYASVSMLAGCCVFVIAVFFGLDVHMPAWYNNDFLLAVPVVLEVLLFLIALVYRDKQIELQRNQAQQQLVEQSEKNRILQENFTRDLERIVKEKTEQLITQRAVLEKEREAKLMAEFEQKFSESELKALRAQINPHFIFNVLNTIESYALQNNREAVSSIIQKFSKLTRLVLENSLQLLVPAAQDLEALKLYIQLEQMRYGEQFEFRYDLEPAVLESNYLIPPMIIQPYVENAILHGLRNLKTSDGLLQVSCYRNANHLSITIEDNGIGRKGAASLKGTYPFGRSSVGMKVTHDRITVLNSLLKDNKAKVEIEDMQRGTKVRLWFPLFTFS